MNDIKQKETVLTIGMFDGVHRGHGKLLALTSKRAAAIGARSLAVSFDGLAAQKSVSLLNTESDREYLIKNLYKIDEVDSLSFTRELSRLSPEDFFYDYLLGRYGASHIIVGENFTFGRDRSGNIDTLNTLCAEANVGCSVIPLVSDSEGVISSSRIRLLLISGMPEKAALLLGHYHMLRGRVEGGRQIGRQIGFPTINIPYPDYLVQMPFGVYITRTVLSSGLKILSVSNFGVRPTFGDSSTPLLETHILNKTMNLYGEEVSVEFLKFLRPERKFSSPEELKTAIYSDIRSAEAYWKVKSAVK